MIKDTIDNTGHKNKLRPIRTNPVLWRAGNTEGVAFTPFGIGEVVTYCNSTFGKDNWDILGGTLYFKFEEDATMFILKYGYQ